VARGLVLAAGVLCGLVGLLITVSIVNDLFLGRTPPSARTALSPDELLACNRDVRGLLEGLVREATRLQLEGLTSDGGEATSESWQVAGERWDRTWREVDARCRFDALADQGLGPAYDRIAWVHRSLPRTKLQYTEWMARFSRDLRPEIGEMRRALDKSQATLQQRAAGPEEDKKP
jgi:hypothetical protein